MNPRPPASTASACGRTKRARAPRPARERRPEVERRRATGSRWPVAGDSSRTRAIAAGIERRDEHRSVEPEFVKQLDHLLGGLLAPAVVAGLARDVLDLDVQGDATVSSVRAPPRSVGMRVRSSVPRLGVDSAEVGERQLVDVRGAAAGERNVRDRARTTRVLSMVQRTSNSTCRLRRARPRRTRRSCSREWIADAPRWATTTGQTSSPIPGIPIVSARGASV